MDQPAETERRPRGRPPGPNPPLDRHYVRLSIGTAAEVARAASRGGLAVGTLLRELVVLAVAEWDLDAIVRGLVEKRDARKEAP